MTPKELAETRRIICNMNKSRSVRQKRKEAEIERLREKLTEITEYWNRTENDTAIVDALYAMIAIAESALKKPDAKVQKSEREVLDSQMARLSTGVIKEHAQVARDELHEAKAEVERLNAIINAVRRQSATSMPSARMGCGCGARGSRGTSSAGAKQPVRPAEGVEG